MKNLSKPFGIVSVLFLIIMAVSPVKEYLREWRQFQQQYNKYIQTLPQRVTPVKNGLKQIWVPELDVIDRCTTCHLGLTNPALQDAPQPYTTHPPMYHQPERFGCTPCHQGQGLATNVEASFGFVENWEKPIFNRPFSESSCGTCHSAETVSHAPVLNRGKELIQKYNCSGCHSIKDLEKGFTPALNGIGSKISREWLVRWLAKPSQVSPSTVMPDFPFSDEEVQLLTDFLLNFKEFDNELIMDPLPPALKDDIPESLYERGETLFRTTRCISCHSINSRGGTVAVELGAVASKANVQWIYNYIKNPGKWQPGVPMSRYNFSEEEVGAVTAYMVEEFIDWDLPEEPEKEQHTPDPNFFEKGLNIFQKYNCGGCHVLGTIQSAGEFGPSLSNMRDKPMYQLEFGQKNIPHTKEKYIIEKIQDPRGFLDNALMPEYQLDYQEILAITTALLSLQEKPIPEQFRVTEKPVPSIIFQGEFGQLVEKYQCLTCHPVFDQGKTIAPDLTRSGSKLQKDWIREYFKLPYTLRPVMTERMPDFFMDDHEIEILTQYITTVLRDDEVEPEINITFSESQIERGEKLYYDTYGCSACHQIDGQGGYVGPPLDELSKRLKPGWIFMRLKNPQKYNPEIREPNFNMTDDEAIALTIFLLSKEKNK